MTLTAALFVETDGVYCGLSNVDPWDESRDARLYAGPHPVIAHPPCKRWGKFWWGGMGATKRFEMGDDGGCFTAALAAVRAWGGVLEHPQNSHAWRHHGLNHPPASGGWVAADFGGGWTCCVEQGHYGHRARKATWLYAVGADLPSLKWGDCGHRVDPARYGGDARKASRVGLVALMGHKERRATPLPFRDLLIAIAESAA